MYWHIKQLERENAKLQAKVNDLQARNRNQKKRMDILANGVAGYHHSEYCAAGKRTKCSKMCDKRYWLAWSYKELKNRKREERKRAIHRRKK